MKDLISKKGIIVAACAIVIALIAAVTMAVSGGNADFGRVISEPVFKPLRSAMNGLVGTLEDIYGYIYRYDSVVAENAQLKERIAELERDSRDYTEIVEENDRLRSLLGFAMRDFDTLPYEMKDVTIIYWTASNFSSSFTINRGASSGIEVGDSVITAEGYLVGVVTEVGSTSSTVVSIIDTTMSVGAILSGTDETGIVEGDFNLFKESRLKLDYIDNAANVFIGDSVLTSGRGGNSPAGLIIGTVESIREDSTGHGSFAVVKPAADLSSVSNLYVITDIKAG
ncbi:MAG: rod shape-determining protein MreC [Oscillospiraceae bacterium]|nr:rod shape-determining protein MreC [Oscillospiraceae bacterium]